MVKRQGAVILPDSNVWASATLHSWFGLIAAESLGTWSFLWTEDIVAEAVRARRRRFPKSSSRQMEAVRDRLVEALGSDSRISNFPHDATVVYTDPDDAHVHSAAVYAEVDYLVTGNIKHFRNLYQNPGRCPYDLMTPDEWLCLAAQSAPGLIDRVILQ
ncbi:PIN domain-containing protein [Corynebacterium heidelbergense]|uniref:PIN domain-containing protein n=1 Tax=Corynebacterium heidelbergense TaxID=2055947 RepID=UPI001EE755B8|nr:PIN domain-containing protein [Corynebacterium heidelbergense]